MRKVIDTNYLNNPNLTAYFNKSPNNHVVLPDFVSMEAYKAGSVELFRKNLAILSKHSTRVIILKGTRDICTLSGRGSGLQGRLIDWKQTSGFRSFCKYHLHDNTPSILLEINRHRQAAEQILEKIKLDSEALRSGTSAYTKVFSPIELKIIRKGEAYPAALIEKIIQKCASPSFKYFRIPPRY